MHKLESNVGWLNSNNHYIYFHENDKLIVYEKGDLQDAKRRSKKAFKLNVMWTICFVVLIVFCILFIGLFVGLQKKNNNNKSGKIRRKKT